MSSFLSLLAFIIIEIQIHADFLSFPFSTFIRNQEKLYYIFSFYIFS